MYAHFANVLCKSVKFGNGFVRIGELSNTTNNARKVEERKIKVDDVEINYARVGTGDHPVLLLPGVLGTIWSHFGPQMEKLDANKLTVIAWDPPGYGKSRPPDRTFPDDVFQRDAAWAHNLMKNLGYSKFSLIAWSYGGPTALLLAALYPDNIRKMVVSGTITYIHQTQIKRYESLRNINNWTKQIRTSTIQAHDEDYCKKICSDWIDSILKLREEQNGVVLCKQVLSMIKCPTLIVCGAKDMMVMPRQSIYIKQNIADSKLYIFEKGPHHLHLKYPEKFNRIVTDFLVSQ